MINKLILGTVQFGLDYGINNKAGQTPKDEAFRILSYGFDHGIRTLDTAQVYGSSEEVIGEYHKQNPDKKYKVITKYKSLEGSFNLGEELDASLERLQVDNLEALLLHDPEVLHQNARFEAEIYRLKEKELIKNIGISVYTNKQIFNASNDNLVDIIQIPFNLLDNNNLRFEAIDYAKSRDKEIHTRSAFMQGLFFIPPEQLPEKLTPLSNDLKLINSLHPETATLALQYPLFQDQVSGVIIGVDTLSQLQSNLDSLDETIDESIFKKVDEIQVKEVDLLLPTNW